jgi:hypothetical protein
VLDDKLLENCYGHPPLREGGHRTTDTTATCGRPGNGDLENTDTRRKKLTHLKRVLDKFDRELTMKRMR